MKTNKKDTQLTLKTRKRQSIDLQNKQKTINWPSKQKRQTIDIEDKKRQTIDLEDKKRQTIVLENKQKRHSIDLENKKRQTIDLENKKRQSIDLKNKKKTNNWPWKKVIIRFQWFQFKKAFITQMN